MAAATMVKAVVLPLILGVLAMAAGASSTEDGPAVAKSGGRFLETQVGRKLLGSDSNNMCGKGSAPDYDCKALHREFKNAKCCQDGRSQRCFDVGGNDEKKCGSCTTECKDKIECCNGVCTDTKTDKNNCGGCGRKCRSPDVCKRGMCDNY